MKHLGTVLLLLLLLVTLPACGGGKADAPTENAPTWQEQYDLGIKFLSEGNYEEAMIAFTAAIEIEPKRAEAYIGLAEVFAAQGDMEKAAEILTQGYEVTGDEALREKLEGLDTEAAEEPVVDEADTRGWETYQAGLEAYFAGEYETVLGLMDTAIESFESGASPADDPWVLVLCAGLAARACYDMGNIDVMCDYFAVAEAHMEIGPPYYNNGVSHDWGGINITYPVSDTGETHGVIYQLQGPWNGENDPEVLMELHFDENGEQLSVNE